MLEQLEKNLSKSDILGNDRIMTKETTNLYQFIEANGFNK